MNPHLSGNCRCLAQCTTSYVLFALLAFMVAHSAQAENFSRVTYDGRKDELVITMRYRGTNPDHTFSLRRGHCKETASSQLHEVVVDVLTLRTAPHFYYTLIIPAAGVRQP